MRSSAARTLGRINYSLALTLKPPEIGYEGHLTFIAGGLHQVDLNNPTPIDLAHGTGPLGTDDTERFDIRHGMVLGYQEAGVAATPCALPPLHRLHSLGPTRLYSGDGWRPDHGRRPRRSRHAIPHSLSILWQGPRGAAAQASA